ncbi:hypothetical protein VNO77_05985 [Canavalia gladiata]|uniref:Uncharacterized protein n=1 Tax=Canavalia gladiata TaxID=3824 RepID=A0AAN9R956_CANGL
MGLQHVEEDPGRMPCGLHSHVPSYDVTREETEDDGKATKIQQHPNSYKHTDTHSSALSLSFALSSSKQIPVRFSSRHTVKTLSMGLPFRH